VEGREPQGVIPPEAYDATRDELIAKLEALSDPQGRPIGTRAFRPEEIYRQIHNIPPDLIVYFGNLAWRAVGSVGLNAIHTFENDTGPDDANHAQNGLFILTVPGLGGRGPVATRSWRAITPTMLELLGLEVPPDIGRESLLADG